MFTYASVIGSESWTPGRCPLTRMEIVCRAQNRKRKIFFSVAPPRLATEKKTGSKFFSSVETFIARV